MGYRDDRDALRAKVEGLERELDATKRELEAERGEDDRVAEIERRMAEARAVLAELEAELARVRGRRGDETRARKTLLIALVLAIGGGAAAAYWVQVRSPPPVPVVAPPPPPMPAIPPAPEPSAPPPKPSPPPPGRRVTAVWPATVKRAKGVVAVDCEVTATLESRGSDIRVPALEVTCGGKPVYRSTDPLNGMSSFSSGVEESAGPEPGTATYALVYEDKGPRTGSRAEVSIDTTAEAAAVWRDSVPAYRVELKLPRNSKPVRGEPLLSATAGSPAPPR